MSSPIRLHQIPVKLYGPVREAWANADVDVLAKLVSKHPGPLLLDCASLILELVPLSRSEEKLAQEFKDLRTTKWTKMHDQLLEKALTISRIEDRDLREACWGIAFEKIVYGLVKQRYQDSDEVCCTNKKVGSSWKQMTSREIDISAWSIPLQQGEFYECQLSAYFENHDYDVLKEALVIFHKPKRTAVVAGLCALVTQKDAIAKIKKRKQEGRVDSLRVIGRQKLRKLQEAFPIL